MKLSIVVTVYSETFSLIQTIEKLIKYDRGYIHEIILAVSPKSSRDCLLICKNLAKKNPIIKIHIQKNTPGVGWAIREGMQLATGDYVGLISADLETEPEAMDRMVKKIEETKCDAVIGNRWLKGGGFFNYDKKKLIFNFIFQNIFRILFKTKLGDLTYGYKILSKKICNDIDWKGVLHEIYIETTIKPIKIGYSIEQIPTIWVGRIEGKSSNPFLNNFRYVRMAFIVLLSSKNSIKK